jgi:uncharacterized protein (DUF3084 family)
MLVSSSRVIASRRSSALYPASPIHLARRTLASMAEDEDDREVAVAKREAEVARREAALADRRAAAEGILENAEVRDVRADSRDDASAQRDKAADLAAFVNPQDADSCGP